MKASFENSVSVLVRAYMNDTLERMQPCGCAGGNLMGRKSDWRWAVTSMRLGNELINECELAGKAQIEEHGYTVEQMMRIENAFMGWSFYPDYRYGNLPDADQQDVFKSLMRTVEVLAEIHGIDLSTKEAAIGQFKEVQLSKI